MRWTVSQRTTAVIARLGESGFGDGDVACPGDAGSGHASPATTVTAWVARGGTLVPGFDDEGEGVGGVVDAKVADGTGGADVTDGDPLIRSGVVDAELAGADGAPLSCVLEGADGDPDDTAGDPGDAAPAPACELEQPAAVATNTTDSAATALCDVVRIRLHPPASFTLSLSQPTFIVNRRHRPRES